MGSDIVRCFNALGAVLLFCAGAASMAYGDPAQADLDAHADARVISVAVREVPPFAMRDGAGNWVGLSVDLWQKVAERLNIEFSWREVPLNETMELLRQGEVDIAIAAVSVTAQREQFIDFSHPYFVTGLSPAFREDAGSAWMATLRNFFSLEFLGAVGSLVLVLLAAGFAVWLFERNANADEFGHGKVSRGLGDGFWWSAVTMTTVGYGDKAPKTVGGRIVALIWMFLSLIIIASFTASIAASLTTRGLSENMVRDRSISELRVGVLAASTAEAYARDRGAVVRTFDTLPDALQALRNEQIDSVIHDAPVLTYEVRSSGIDGLAVDETVLARDDYAFAFPESSGDRNRVNIALLSILFEPDWSAIRARYLGDSGR